MKPKKTMHAQEELFRNRLSNQLNPKDSLFVLSSQINWQFFEEEFGAMYRDGPGQPPLPVRLMVGLMMLQHMHGLSDEMVAHQWVQNPYWQYFCGFDYLQWSLPCDPSSLTRWRKRLGPQGIEKILSQTIEMAIKTGTVVPKDLETVIADTTVMEKNITFPTDTKLLHRAREKLVKMAQESGISLRQTYSRIGKRTFFKATRYAHAKQFKRMAKEVKKLKNYLGRTLRDIERKITGDSDLYSKFNDLISMSKRLLTQTKESTNKLYSLHAPETYCIAKGKVGKPYEFGCKVSLVVTHAQGLALACTALSTNQFDGHTLKDSLEKAEELSGVAIKKGFVDKGYKGHKVQEKQIFISGQKKGMTKTLRTQLKRRSAIEPHIGHMKQTGKLRRNYLKGIIGDALNALLCAIGHNLRMILRILFLCLIFVLKITRFFLIPTQHSTLKTAS